MNFDLNSAAVFVEVVSAGSFTQAAKRLNLPTSTVSDRIGALERVLGTPLLIRTTRSLKLTDEGRNYFDRCAPAIRDLSTAFQETTSSQKTLSGILRISCPHEFASRAMAEAIAIYRKKFPEMKVELVTTNEISNFSSDQIDLAIRGGQLSDSTLKAKKLGASAMVLAASPEYIKGNPKIRTPQDLKDHDCINFFGAYNEGFDGSWKLQSTIGQSAKVKPKFSVSCNSFLTTAELIDLGQGIGLIADIYVRDAVAKGRAVRVLPEWSSGPIPLHLVYPWQRVESRKVKEMIPILSEKLSKTLECLKR